MNIKATEERRDQHGESYGYDKRFIGRQELKEKCTKNDRFIILALKHLGRCVYLSCKKGLWKDVIKYGNLIYEYTLDNDEKWGIQDYLSQAYFYQGNYERELFYRKRILDQNDYLSLYNYALALFHNHQSYEEAKLYNQLCIRAERISTGVS